METRAREPPRDQGRGEARTAAGDGGEEPKHHQVCAVIYLRGLEGSLGGECQFLPPKLERGGRGLASKEHWRRAALLLKVVSKGGILPSYQPGWDGRSFTPPRPAAPGLRPRGRCCRPRPAKSSGSGGLGGG